MVSRGSREWQVPLGRSSLGSPVMRLKEPYAVMTQCNHICVFMALYRLLEHLISFDLYNNVMR